MDNIKERKYINHCPTKKQVIELIIMIVLFLLFFRLLLILYCIMEWMY